MRANAVQEEGPTPPLICPPVRLSRVFRPDEARLLEEQIPLRRKVAWGLVWVSIAIGVALYFTYARILTPLLAS